MLIYSISPFQGDNIIKYTLQSEKQQAYNHLIKLHPEISGKNYNPLKWFKYFLCYLGMNQIAHSEGF